ncbi:MAG: hypothetical protein PHG66_04410 [Candidatus Colwellbacteria bacterium]|nr:hypothetical protein [Candidatus Colwellbacteria bacterium]
MFKCEFCDKQLSSKYNLKTHQTTTRYCIEKQHIAKDKTTDVDHLRDELATQKEKSRNELATQKEYYENLLTQSREENLVLKKENEIYNSLLQKEQEFLHRQAEKVTTVTNNSIKGKNITMNALNLSQERLESIKDTYTIKHYERGGIGQADWVVDNVIRDESGTLIYKCTDKNRKNFIYHDNKGNVVTDIHAKKLKEAILPIMNTKLKEFKKIKCAELAEISDDESELLEQYSNLYNENKSMGNEFDKRLIEKTY